MAYKEIPLNKGAVTIVDESDYDRLMKFKWRISDKGYAMRTQTDKGKASGILMHRMLLDPPKGFMADHINGDRLDNRRCNLRLANALENARNRANNHNSRSKYKGVAWKVENNKWQARIRIVGKQHHIGLFDTEEDAAYAYNQAAILQHGNFARLNTLPKGYAMPEKPKECPLCHRATEPVSSVPPVKIIGATCACGREMTFMGNIVNDQPVDCIRDEFDKWIVSQTWEGHNHPGFAYMAWQAAWGRAWVDGRNAGLDDAAKLRKRESGVHGYEISGNTIYIGPMRPDRIKVADITCTIDWDETYTEEAKARRIRDAERICRGLDHE